MAIGRAILTEGDGQNNASESDMNVFMNQFEQQCGVREIDNKPLVSKDEEAKKAPRVSNDQEAKQVGEDEEAKKVRNDQEAKMVSNDQEAKKVRNDQEAKMVSNDQEAILASSSMVSEDEGAIEEPEVPFYRNLNLQMVSSDEDAASRLRLSVWDMGGQNSFTSLLAMFISRWGIFIIVFSMQLLWRTASQVLNSHMLIHDQLAYVVTRQSFFPRDSCSSSSLSTRAAYIIRYTFTSHACERLVHIGFVHCADQDTDYEVLCSCLDVHCADQDIIKALHNLFTVPIKT
jgi:hypothetical protein